MVGYGRREGRGREKVGCLELQESKEGKVWGPFVGRTPLVLFGLVSFHHNIKILFLFLFPFFFSFFFYKCLI